VLTMAAGMDRAFSCVCVFVYSCSKGGSLAEWLACWTQVRKGLSSNRSRDAVLGKLFTPVVPLFTKQQNW